MDLELIKSTEARYQAARALVDVAAAELVPLAAAHVRGQQALYAAQRALEPIAQERGYLQQQYQIENIARSSRQELAQPRAMYDAPRPPGAMSLPVEPPSPRSLGEDALRDACAHVWLDRASELRLGFGAEYVTVATDDPNALRALQEHLHATGAYLSIVRRLPRRVGVRD